MSNHVSSFIPGMHLSAMVVLKHSSEYNYYIGIQVQYRSYVYRRTRYHDAQGVYFSFILGVHLNRVQSLGIQVQ